MKIPTNLRYAKKFKNPAKFDNKFYENADHFVITLPLYRIFYKNKRTLH